MVTAMTAMVGTAAGGAGAAAPAAPPRSLARGLARLTATPVPPTTVPAGPATDGSLVDDLLPDRDLDDCVSALPQPDCGSTARSGWRQWLIFGLLVVAIAFIAWRIVRSARRRRPAHDA